jgi:ABC-type Mn2+/Zn2+ transport systems, permease components
MIKTLIEIFSHSFLLRAIIVGLMISICASLLGVSLILKKYAMIGDGLSHVGFGALAIATALNVSPLFISIPAVLIAAFLLLKLNDSNQIKGDSAIALISTSSLALGVLVISKISRANIDLSSYMFGSILALKPNDTYLSIGLSIIVLILFVLFYHKIFAVTFDETFAQATGTNINFYNMLIASLTAITIVVGMRMMGTLLISSLVIFPGLTAMRITKTFKMTIIIACFSSIICFLIGFIISFKFVLPTGASIVGVHLLVFIIISVLIFLKKRLICNHQ